jgi:uncharacterized protein YdeI (YjbR/CyaY-like superfamily)
VPVEDTPQVEVRSRAELRAWLEANHASSGPVWLVTYKKHHPDHLAWGDRVDELLCFGWIDSLQHRVDDDRSRQYVSPRKPGSNWSGINKRKVAALQCAGLMTEAGRAVITRAKRDGSWTFLDDIEALVIPPDLQALLAGNAEAAANFQAFPRSVRMQFLYWLKSAKTEATRARRLDGTLRAAQQDVRVPGQAR